VSKKESFVFGVHLLNLGICSDTATVVDSVLIANFIDVVLLSYWRMLMACDVKIIINFTIISETFDVLDHIQSILSIAHIHFFLTR
jgi:hypothetical protein